MLTFVAEPLQDVARQPLTTLRIKRCFLAAVIAASCCTMAAADQRTPPRANFKDTEAIAAVQAGRSDTANAAWWGFDPQDATSALQAAIDSGAAKVVVPYMGTDWIVRPIILRSNQDIFFEPGVIVTAKQGEFRNERDALFTATAQRNVALRGYGTVLRMRKADYVAAPYAPSEWRHVLALHGVADFRISGLSLHSSGGDGIYIGPTWDGRRIPCENVSVEDCLCNDNLRQGISIVSGRNILVHNCTFRNTRGKSPEAGVDVEPSSERDIIVNVEIRNCLAIHNEGTGYFASLSRLNADSEPVSLRFVNCRVLNTRQSGFRAFLREDSMPSGVVEFINCTSEGANYAGAQLAWNLSAPLRLRFADCKWRKSSVQSSQSPVEIQVYGSPAESGGSIEFQNCYVYEDGSKNPVRFTGAPEQNTAVTGQIHYINSAVEPTQSFSLSQLPQLEIKHHKQQW